MNTTNYPYRYECKQDKHKTWTAISVETKHPVTEWELEMLVNQYAERKQVNPDTVAIRCLNMSNDVVAQRDSGATVNKGK